jgi:hypothetical protein
MINRIWPRHERNEGLVALGSWSFVGGPPTLVARSGVNRLKHIDVLGRYIALPC